jgi:hypothetical protein
LASCSSRSCCRNEAARAMISAGVSSGSGTGISRSPPTGAWKTASISSSARKEIADRSHRRRSLLHGEMADARHHEDLRLRNETRPDFRLTGRQNAVLLAPHNQSFVGNAAQPTTEIRMTKPVRLEDIAERFALALTRGAKLMINSARHREQSADMRESRCRPALKYQHSRVQSHDIV